MTVEELINEALSLRGEIDRVTSRIIYNAHDREDIYQDTLLKLIVKGQTYSPERGSKKRWILTIAVNTAKDLLRKKLTACVYSETSVPDMLDLNIMNFLSKDGNEEPDTLPDCFINVDRVLSNDLNDVFVLRHRVGLDYNTISNYLGIPTGTVKSRLSRIKVEARKFLE